LLITAGLPNEGRGGPRRGRQLGDGDDAWLDPEHVNFYKYDIYDHYITDLEQSTLFRGQTTFPNEHIQPM
jgi:hypothetical protein